MGMDIDAGAERGCSVSSVISWLVPFHVVKGPGKKSINQRPIYSSIYDEILNILK